MKRALKTAVIRALGVTFRLGQHLGVDILPRHFYSEIPDLRVLRRTTSWKKPYSLIGVPGSELAGQVEFLRSLVPAPLAERLARADVHERACERNGERGYGPIEADCLFAFVHTRRPARIVQIGCGVSTAVCLLAAEEAGYSPSITCIDPYPTGFLKSAAASGRITLKPVPVQDLPCEEVVSGLQSNDLFFVDSTHTLGPAGEVTRIILEHLPRLPAGAFAHFHDIYFPYDYTQQVLTDLCFPHESALLHAFLAFNARFRLLAALSQVHYGDPAALRSLFAQYRPRSNDCGLMTSPGDFPSSAYLHVTS